MTPERDGTSEGFSVHAALVGAQLGFALFPFFGKLALVTLPPLPLAALRVVASAALLEILRRATRSPLPAPSDRRMFFLLSLLGVAFNQILFIVGLSLTTAANTSILMATIPVFTLAAAVLLGRERFTARVGIGLALALLGAFVLLDIRRFDWSSGFVRGDLLLLGNCLFYSFYLVLAGPLMARYNATTSTTAVFLGGAGPIVLFALPSLTRFSPRAVTPQGWVSLAAIVVFCTALPYLWNAWALARVSASRVAFSVFLQPLLGAAAAVVFLSERLAPHTVAAGALILAGLAVTISRARP